MSRPKERCPHCRATVGVSPGRGGALRCRICGGPRVVIDDARLVLSGDEAPHLIEARKLRRAAWLWTGAAFMAGGLGAFFLLLVTGALLAFRPETIPSVVALVLGSLPLMAALAAARRGRAARRRAAREQHEAQLSAARDVLRGAGRELTAQQLARYLRLPLLPTEHLLAELNVDDSMMSDVTEAGEVTYRLAPLRLRIEEAFAQGDLEEVAAGLTDPELLERDGDLGPSRQDARTTPPKDAS